MARRRILISPASGGGIQLGAPATVDGVLFLEQVIPSPFANTQRLARILDASQSIIAPGVNSGVGSFVMGRNVLDPPNGARVVLLGDSITTSNIGAAGTMDDQVLVGAGITMDPIAVNCQQMVVVGGNVSWVLNPAQPYTGGDVMVGYGHVAKSSVLEGATNITCIGQSNNITGSECVAIGSGVTLTSGFCVAVGHQSLAGNGSVSVGFNAQGANFGIAIGDGSRAADYCLAIGYGAATYGQVNNIALGFYANAKGAADQCMIGGYFDGAALPLAVANLCWIGSPAPHGYTTFVLGQGYQEPTGAVQFLWRTSEVAGVVDMAGNGLQIRAGCGTGNWANGENLGIDLQVGLAGATGATQQAYTSVLAIRQADLNVALWGGLGATFGGGQLVVFIQNATTVPTVAPTGGGILYATAGALHWLGSGGTDTAIAPA